MVRCVIGQRVTQDATQSSVFPSARKNTIAVARTYHHRIKIPPFRRDFPYSRRLLGRETLHDTAIIAQALANQRSRFFGRVNEMVDLHVLLVDRAIFTIDRLLDP